MTTILDKFVSAKNSVKELSQGTQDFISYIVDLGGIGNRDIGNIVELFDDVDESVIESAKSLKEGTITLDQFKSIAESTSSSTTKLATSLKSVATNMAIMIAISLAIKGVIALWDKANVTVEEVQSKIDDLTSSISTLKSEYQELSSKENLTSSEQKRLKYLEDRISLEERLLKVEEERLAKEKYGDKFTDYFDKDSYAHKTFFDSDDSLYNETERNTDRTQYTVNEYKKAVQNGDEEKKLEYTTKLEQKRLEYEEAYLKNQKAISDIQDDINNGLITEAQGKKWIAKYQDSIGFIKKQMDDIDSIIPHLQDKMYRGEAEIKSAIEKFGNGSEVDLEKFFKDNSINTSEEIDYWNEVTKGAKSAKEAVKMYNDAKKDTNEADISLPDTETLKQQISDLNSAIDSIQSAYDTLNSAVEEYNSNGGTLSIDTIQSLLSLSDEYLACLQVENGQLSLNADAMNALAQSKLDEAQAIAVTQAMTELETIAKGENAQSTTNYISGNAALMSSLAQLSGSYEGVAQAAMTAAQAQKLSAFISNASAKDKTATENVMKGLDTKLKLIQSTQNKIKSSGLGFSKKSSKNSSPTQSTTNKEKEYLDSYMTYMNKMLEGGKISYQQYVQQVSDKLEHMFKAGKISAKEYFDYTEKRLEQQKSVFDSALKAITGKLDDAIEEWQDKIKSLEKENDSYNDELDKYSSILSAIDKVYDNEINRIQDIIDGLKDANSEKERSIALEKAQWELDKARNQKTKKIYANGQYIYTTDSEAIRNAQENLNSAKLDVTISNLEKQIEVLEDFKTKWADIAKAFSTAQDEMNAKAMYGENFQYIILQNRLNDIFSFEQRYTAIEKKINDNQLLIDSYNEKVEYYQDLKEQWNSISSAYEEQLNRQHAAEILGANWEADVLSGRLSTLESFKNSYIAIQQQITQAAIDSANAQANASNIASSGSGGGGGSSYSGGSSSGNEKVVQLQRFMNQVFGSNLTEDGIMGSKTKEAIKHMQLLIGASQTGVYDKATYNKLKYYVGKILKENDKTLYNIARSLGYPAYAKGTTNAKKGVALVSEKEHGDEIIIDNKDNAYVAEGEQLHYFEGGETVIKASESEKILTNMENLTPLQDYVSPFSGMNLQPIDYSSMVMSSLNLPNFSKLATVNRDNSTSVSIGEIHLHEVNNVDSFANAIIRELPSKISQKLG